MIQQDKKDDKRPNNLPLIPLGYGVNPRPIQDPPQQDTTWTCRKCGIAHRTFESFLFDGCSPVYPRGGIEA